MKISDFRNDSTVSNTVFASWSQADVNDLIFQSGDHGRGCGDLFPVLNLLDGKVKSVSAKTFADMPEFMVGLPVLKKSSVLEFIIGSLMTYNEQMEADTIEPAETVADDVDFVTVEAVTMAGSPVTLTFDGDGYAYSHSHGETFRKINKDNFPIVSYFDENNYIVRLNGTTRASKCSGLCFIEPFAIEEPTKEPDALTELAQILQVTTPNNYTPWSPTKFYTQEGYLIIFETSFINNLTLCRLFYDNIENLEKLGLYTEEYNCYETPLYEYEESHFDFGNWTAWVKIESNQVVIICKTK